MNVLSCCASLDSLVRDVVLLVCTVGFCMLFWLFVQFSSACCFPHLSSCFSQRPEQVLDVLCVNSICNRFIVLNDLLSNGECVELLRLFVPFGSACRVAYLYSLVLHVALLICTVWICISFCLFVQFDSAYRFAYLYSLDLHLVLLICTVWLCMYCFAYLHSLVLHIICLFVQFGSACFVFFICTLRFCIHCVAYSYSLILHVVFLICTVWFCISFCLFVQFGSACCPVYVCSLVLHNACLFVQFGSVYCVAYLYSLVLHVVLLICTG